MRIIASGLLLLVACGCTSTTSVGLRYTAPPTIARATTASAKVMPGTFIDQRGEPATWLGAIRGGYGNPLKNLESDRPVAELVKAAFVDGLRARGIDVEGAGAAYQLGGVIRKLDCNQYVRREANVEIDVSVVEVATGQQRFTRTYNAANIDGSILSLSTGIFASVEDLRVLTEKTLRDAVDAALDDSALRGAMQM